MIAKKIYFTPLEREKDVRSLLSDFERSFKVSVEMEFIYNRAEDVCESTCNRCERFPSDCNDWICSHSHPQNRGSDAPNDSPWGSYRASQRTFDCPRVPATCAYAIGSSNNGCIHPDRGPDVCPDCVDYTPACSVDINNINRCEYYDGACPCDDIVRNCSRCSRFREVLATKQQELTSRLVPVGSNYSLKKGALVVKTDGSIPDGLEIPIVGRKVDYKNLFDGNKIVIDAILDSGATVTSKCGTHMHMLMGYHNISGQVVYENELPIPIEVLANIYTLNILFMDSLLWITSSGDEIDHFTRWSMFRQIPNVPPPHIVDPNGVFHGMRFRDWINRLPGAGNRYAFMNPSPLQYTDDGNIRVFHIEARYPDGILSPTAVTCLQILQAAIVRKSIKMLSEGILGYPRSDLERILSFSRRITDWDRETHGNWPNDEDNRRGNAFLNKSELSKLKHKTISMIDFFRPEILYFGEEPLLLLKYMAKEPCSVLLSKKRSWKYIEDNLNRIGVKIRHIDPAIKQLHIVMDKRMVLASSPTKWFTEAAKAVETTSAKVKNYIFTTKNIVWDNGTFIRI